MEHTKLALTSVMIVAVGLIGTNFVTGLEMTGQEKFDALSSSNEIFGHITIVHSDPDGNVLSYIQTDNIVAANGKDCLSELVFEVSTVACSASVNTKFTTIALYNGDSFPLNMNTTDVSPSDNNVLDTGNIITALGLTIRDGGQSVSVSEKTPADPSNAAVGSATDIAKTFTAGAGVTAITIDGATLLNNGSGGANSGPPTAVLAGQNFAPVTLNDSDTLLITWTITLG